MVVMKNNGDAKPDAERKIILPVFSKGNWGETVAWNIFEVSSMFEIMSAGKSF